MEKDNFDFYQEALKAFDAPIPQPKKEEPAVTPTAEVTESAPQEKPRRKFNPWWAVALCALLCLVLFIGFGRKPEPVSRGENYVYGILLEATDEYMILSHHQMFWYVELKGLENPYDRFGVDTYLWVFYDGEAEKTDLRGCDRKITATYWKADETEGAWEDQIEYDLDGDGAAENWSLTRTVWMDHVINIPTMNITLTAKDSKGTILHNVHFYLPSSTDSVVFQNSGDGLSLVISRLATYEVLPMRIEDGKLAVYLNGEAQKLYPHTNEPGPVVTLPTFIEPVWTTPTFTDPPGTLPTVPTTPDRTQDYSVQFFLGNRSSDTGEVLSSQLNQMTDEEGEALKARLDQLTWLNGEVESFQSAGYFVLSQKDQLYEDGYYSFSHDGRLMHRGKVAAMDADLVRTLMDLMTRLPLADQSYFALLDDGQMARLTFAQDGWVQALLFETLTAEPQSYEGCYATFGKYYYLALGENLDNVMVLQLGDAALQYIDAMSSRNLFQLKDATRFYLNERGGSFSLVLRNADGTYANRNELSTLTVWENADLRRQLKRRTWNTLEHFSEDQVLGRFTIYDGTGSDIAYAESYYLLTGCRLYKSNANQYSYITAEDQTLWSMLCAAMQKQSYPLKASFGGVNQDGMKLELQMMEDGNYQFSAQLKHESIGTHVYSSGSSYVRLGDCMVLLGWHDGPSYVHLDIQGDRLVYDAARSTPDLAFSQTKEATLYNLQVNLYRTVNLEITMPDGQSDNMITYQRSYVILPEKLAKELSLILNSVQWVEPEHWSGGICMGTIHFVESMDAPVEIYSGMRLVRGCYEAKLTQSQWETICQIMSEGSGIVYASATASENGETYALTLSGNRMFTLAHQLEQNQVELVYGAYSLFDNDLLLCYGYDGQMFALRKEDAGWRLVLGYNGLEIFDLPDNTLFAEPMALPEGVAGAA